MAAFRAIRLVRSAISRMVPMNPVIRWVSAPRVATWSALAATKPLSPTRRVIASPITTRFRLATAAAVPLASAAWAPCSAMARLEAESAVVDWSPPATNCSRSAEPRRIPCEVSLRAEAETRSESATRASAVTCSPIWATVLSSGRRSSAMWMAVAIWFERVPSASRSLAPYACRLG